MSEHKNAPLKRLMDEKKIHRLGFPHAYDYSDGEWKTWTGNNYIKSHYDVLLADGSVIEHCWPNAGKMNKGKYQFEACHDVKVRLSESAPF